MSMALVCLSTKYILDARRRQLFDRLRVGSMRLAVRGVPKGALRTHSA